LTKPGKYGIKAQLVRGGPALESREATMPIQSFDAVLFGLVIILLVKLLGLEGQVAVGRIRA
jgi:hypothetical protein